MPEASSATRKGSDDSTVEGRGDRAAEIGTEACSDMTQHELDAMRHR